MTDGLRRGWRPDWPVSLLGLLGGLRRGPGDPTFRLDGDQVWRGIRAPSGPATLRLEVRPADGEVLAQAWGPGAAWVLDGVPSLLGGDDDPGDFRADLHPLVAEAHRRRPQVRFGATHLLWEALLPAVIEQKVTGQEAFGGFRRLVHRYGERAPGPGRELHLWVQPDPATVRRIPSWEWLRLHVDPARSRTLVRAAGLADALGRLTAADADAKLRTVPGIGEWTSAEVRSRTFGDPDAVPFGDYHVAKDIGWAVTGAPYDDEQLREFLEPWRPQRNRAVVLIHGLAGGRPRRGPRMAPRTHLPVR
ncbi:MAG TPA: DNA-3-methyladenine glycosylase 2 family protein [Nocardioides sp.]|uniref:DNA-3-methyladenine glycosylase family protein n=1 Tax=Nocardioides sp. TaxID=35761 RepID=UPI002E305B16|nr:DNA-3-methyladenine glycosylase 2 family protein [Nocardioides sp.]HEX3931229.1 DNA-3-methyladenine glycosylase 2 family protein [Nocardioides sp.]